MSMIFRSVKENDLDAIFALATESGIGLTTLPKEKIFLQARVQNALESFQKSVSMPEKEYYLFVLEDLTTNLIVGTAAIEAITGRNEIPFYAYQHVKESRRHTNLQIESTHEYLNPTYENEGNSELCTLYLNPAYRHSGNGLLLSLARFLFIYNFPERFASSMIAELRGVSDENGHSPFWDAVGAHFYNMSFSMADQLTLTNKQFIADLMPTHPIYINLLNSEAKSVIGIPHSNSIPAMKILLREGFHFNGTVDIFDAGPTLKANCKEIRTIIQSQTLTVEIEKNLTTSNRFLLSNTCTDFRAIQGNAKLIPAEEKCLITPSIANQLYLSSGDNISISAI